jgi:hypothetical protein
MAPSLTTSTPALFFNEVSREWYYWIDEREVPSSNRNSRSNSSSSVEAEVHLSLVDVDGAWSVWYDVECTVDVEVECFGLHVEIFVVGQ